MISKPRPRPETQQREAAGRACKQALCQARTPKQSAHPREPEPGARGAALRAAPPGPRTE
eukprot:14865648-Alexandrium_andersonii.AAC.1